VSRVLLDTHTLLRFVANDPALPESPRALVEEADEVFVSVASAWEIAIKVNLGKLSIDAATPEAFFEEQMRINGLVFLPIAPAHVFRAAALPPHHRDPFDRLLIAQAIVEGLDFVTRENFSAYGVTTCW
jgi:PIN domain nuclease of toxin-antitoxin system